MKNFCAILSIIILSFGIVSAQETDQKSVNVTIYNQNFGVVKDVRKLNITKGVSEIQIRGVAKLIDPTSVHIKFDGAVIEQNYRYDLANMNVILDRYIDKEIMLVGKESSFSGELMSYAGNQLVIKQKDGGIVMLPNYNEYRLLAPSLPEGLISKPTLNWLVNSTKDGNHDVEISYQTQGLNWHTEYVALLNKDDSKLDMSAWISIENNSGAQYKNANLKLVAGDVNRVDDLNLRKAGGLRAEMAYMDKVGSEPQFEEKEFFEYHIYDLQRPTTISDKETKQVSLFETTGVPINKLFIYNSNGNNIENGKPEVFVEFINSAKSALGMPMPKGKVRLYKSDEKDLEFIGEDLIDHTPKDEKVKLKVGEAFDIRIDEKIVSTKQISRNVSDSEFEVKIKNRKKDKSVVYIDRMLYSNWEILEKNHDYEKLNAYKVRFKIDLPADTEKTLKYKVRFNY